MKTLRQRTEALLSLHDGSCFVPSDSKLLPEFEAMEKAGIVKSFPVDQPNGREFREANFTFERKTWKAK